MTVMLSNILFRLYSLGLIKIILLLVQLYLNPQYDSIANPYHIVTLLYSQKYM